MIYKEMFECFWDLFVIMSLMCIYFLLFGAHFLVNDFLFLVWLFWVNSIMVLQKIMDDDEMTVRGIQFSVSMMQTAVVQFRSNTFGIARKDPAPVTDSHASDPPENLPGPSTLLPAPAAFVDHGGAASSSDQQFEQPAKYLKSESVEEDFNSSDSDEDAAAKEDVPELQYKLVPDADKVNVVFDHATEKWILYNSGTHEAYDLPTPGEEYIVDSSSDFAVLFDLAKPADANLAASMLSEWREPPQKLVDLIFL